MSDLMTAEEFAAKVDCEGGVVEALEYGLTRKHLSPEEPLYDKWVTLERWYEQGRHLIYEVEQALEGIYEDDEW